MLVCDDVTEVVILRNVVADAAGDEPVVILAGELSAIGRLADTT
jgi:hypothetical protein